MKKDIHPKYNKGVKVKCANCGTEFEFGTTADSISVEICSGCHPIFTGKKTMVDSTGRVDRFKQRQAKASLSKEEVQEESEKEAAEDKKVEETKEEVASEPEVKEAA